MPDLDPTETEAAERAFTLRLFAPDVAEPDEHDVDAPAARNLFAPESDDAEHDEPDDDTRTTRRLFS